MSVHHTDCGFISGLATTVTRRCRKAIGSLLADCRAIGDDLPVVVVPLNDDDYAVILDGKKFFALLLSLPSHHAHRRRPRRCACLSKSRACAR